MRPVRRGLGILGGTFDPPHIGHLAAAVEVYSALHLERVVLMVANDPWQKSGSRTLSPPQTRLSMTQRAAEGLEGIEVSDLEIVRGGPTYSVDTLMALRDAEPDQQLFLIVGADAAAALETWHRHDELARLATLVIVDREGERETIPPPGWEVVRVAVPRLDISSSELRERAQSGGSLEPYVVPAVMNEIRTAGLYGFTDS